MKRTQAVGFVHLGQLSYLVDIGGLKVGCDVFLTPLEGRLVNPPVKPEELLDVEVFLWTHDHADHIDRPLWRRLAGLGCTAKFLVPAYVAADVVRDTGLKKSQIVGMTQGENDAAYATIEVGEAFFESGNDSAAHIAGYLPHAFPYCFCTNGKGFPTGLKNLPKGTAFTGDLVSLKRLCIACIEVFFYNVEGKIFWELVDAGLGRLQRR